VKIGASPLYSLRGFLRNGPIFMLGGAPTGA
jgi:hypothetical protein